MASHNKKASEGIALLSIYGDEDDEIEEMDYDDEHDEQRLVGEDPSARNLHSVSSPSPLKKSVAIERHSKEAIAVMDYGHDDVVMSPEQEEGEVMKSMQIEDRAVINGDLQDKMVHVRTLTQSNDQVEAGGAEPTMTLIYHHLLREKMLLWLKSQRILT